MERISKMWRSGLAMLLALCLLISACPVTAFATDGDESISYVALGASNTNGFGLMGYLPENLYNNPVNKMTGSVYGYQMEPAKAYPALVKNALAEMTGKNVELEQLAISSMRAEELHVLLDNEYYGDKYTEWRFTGGQNWFNMANPGGLNGLRAEYQEFVKNADVITVDIGANNFGVYASNRIFNNMFDADFTRFDEGTQRDVATVKSEINKLLNKYVVGALTPELAGMFDHIVDTMTYAVVGFCVNFDASMKRIYELNPDATVVVVNIQNLMHDLYATLPGMDQPIPFGDFYGAIVNIANTYVASMSPYADQYYYAYIGANGQAETFLKDIQNYTGNPADLRTAVTDCFDVYDNDMYAKTRVLQALAKVYLPTGQVTLKKDYTKYTLADLENLNKFSEAVYDNAILFGGVPVQDFLKMGAAGKAGQLQAVYDQYHAALMTVYDTAATFMQLGANSAVMDLAAAAANFSTAGKSVLQQFFAMLMDSMENPGLKIEETPEYQALANDSTAMAIITLGVRSDLGNSFFSHPNENGHAQIKNAICTALKEAIKGEDVVKEHALSALKGFLEEYGPEAAEQAYQYLLENGYIDMARTEIEELVKYLNENKDALVEEMIPMIEAAIEALEAQNEELKAVLKSLKAELEALNAELEKASGEAAEQIKQAIAQIEAAIAEIEALIAQVNKQIAEMNAAVEELIEAAKAIAEQVEVAIENAEALAESIVALVETLKETGTASVEAIAAAVEQARKTVLLAAETLEQAIELVTTQVADAVAMAEKITEQITALYQDVTSTLDEIIAKLPSDVQGAIKGAAEEIQKALDEAIAGVNADLQKAIDELKATIGAEIDAKKAELEALLDKIDAHVEEKAAGIKAAAEAQIAALKAEAEAKIAEINKKLEAEIAKLEAAANAQIDEIKGQIEALKAQAEAQIAKIQAEVEAQIAAIEAIIAEKEAQLKDLYAQLENASAEAKAKIEAQIAAVEAEIAKLEAQIEALKAQAEAQIAKVKAEVEALNAKIQAIIADTQAQIEDLKAQAEAQIETVKAQLKAAVEKINADLKAKIDAIRAEVEATYANAVAALEKAIADLEEKLNAEIAKLKAQAEAQIAKLKAAAEAELEKLNALGQAAADVVNGIIEQVQDQLNTVNETVKAMMNSSVEEAAKLAEKLAEDLKGLGEEALNALVDELNEVLYDAFVKATTADLGLNEESTYIALGDGTAAPESYVEMLGEKLKAEYGVENIVNYAKNGNTVGDEIKAIADREGIADADLITIGFGNVTLVENAFNNAMKDEPASYNWVELVGEELVPYVQDALADIYAEIAAAGLDEETTEMLNIMVEGIAYGAVEYAIELPALINAIRAVNTDAVVIIVGQYNPMDGVVLEFGGMFGAPLVTLDIADYINYLVDGVAAHGIAYSMITGDAIFVEAPQVDTDNTDMSWGLKDLMQFMVYGFGVLNPSESGDGYITNQILEALNISKIEVKPEEPVKPVNPFVDVPEGAFYYDAVMWAVDLGITTGTQDGTTFEPNSPCTRAHIATFLWRAAGCPEPESTVMPFKDVAEGKFYTTAVLWAAENGITNGTGDGTTFEPNATCTRGQIVTMLARYLKGEPTGNDNPFKDVPANAYYTNPVLWAVENGITNGTQDGTTFEPNSPCTRGHIVTFLYRALNK